MPHPMSRFGGGGPALPRRDTDQLAGINRPAIMASIRAMIRAWVCCLGPDSVFLGSEAEYRFPDFDFRDSNSGVLESPPAWPSGPLPPPAAGFPPAPPFCAVSSPFLFPPECSHGRSPI